MVGHGPTLQMFELLNETVALFNVLGRPTDTSALLNHGKQILEQFSR